MAKASKTTTIPKKGSKVIKKKVIAKKVTQRISSIEATIKEGRDFIARFDSKKITLAKTGLISKKTPIPRTIPMVPTPPSRKLSAKLLKAKATTVIKSKPLKSKKLLAVAAVPASTAPRSSISTGKPTPSNIQKELDCCEKIASTEKIINAKLGNQIIKRPLNIQKNDPKQPAQKSQAKKKVMRTKTGERLAAGMIDVVFCCDTTGSMSSELAQCMSTVKAIMKKILSKTASEGISVKFGFVAYRDHPPQDNTYLTCSYDLTSEEEILEFIGSLEADGGGDVPEAVFDGLYVAAKHMSWRDSTHIPSLRYIFHIADAPPHGKQYYGQAGKCKCDLDIHKVSHIINLKQIHYRFIGTSSSTDKMVKEFKKHIVDFEDCKIQKAVEMDIRISDMIIRELLPDMVEE